MEICAMRAQKNESGPIGQTTTEKQVPAGSSARPDAGESAGLVRTDASKYGALPGYFIERYVNRTDIPRADAEELLVEYAQMMHARVTSGGGPDFDWRRHVEGFWAGLDGVLPPNGSYLLVRDRSGAIVGTAALRRVSETTGEMKHLYIRPVARRTGLGEALVRARIEDARALGMRWLIADTFKVNPELPALYAKLGFVEMPPSGDSKSTAITPEIEQWMWFYRYDLTA
jgi:GNAT superfamily N-acetyltransferase